MMEDKNVLVIGDMVSLYNGRQKCPHNGNMVSLYDGGQKCPHNGRLDRQKCSCNGEHGFLMFLQTQTFLSICLIMIANILANTNIFVLVVICLNYDNPYPCKYKHYAFF